MGALDVCPFIPVRGVGMDECVLCAQAFGQRLAEELGVPGECPTPFAEEGVLISGVSSASPFSHSVPTSTLHHKCLYFGSRIKCTHDPLNMQIVKKTTKNNTNKNKTPEKLPPAN